MNHYFFALLKKVSEADKLEQLSFQGEEIRSVYRKDVDFFVG